ncbi:hypothetical protein [Zavarzinia sp. CC-PAN008]|uniref:hypothetical protein n=1 Tax=Zavarzinia sp. CC-PAN008 TaxID=3243332 RepID=UPI003F74834B
MSGDLQIRLDHLALDLRAVARGVEERFLRSGEVLGPLVDVLGRLTRLFEDLPATLDTPELGQALATLEHLAQEADAMASALVREREALTGLVALNRVAGKRIAQLRATMGLIGMLAFNARLAVSQSGLAQQGLVEFVNEIIRLARNAQATVDRYGEDHERLSGLLAGAADGLGRFEAEHGRTLRSISGALAQNAAQVTERRRQAVDGAGAIGARARHLGDGVARAVMVLQIGDITRQRLEHVDTALSDLAQVLGGEGSEEAWSQGLDGDARQAVVAALCGLQAAQIEPCRAELAREVTGLEEALGALVAEVTDLLALGAATYGGGERRGEKQAQSILAEVEGRMRQTGEMIDRYLAERDQLDRVGGELAGALAALMDQVATVRRIETDMRLVGLNTTLRCGRLGDEGRALRVIAQELRRYANQTIVDAEGLVGALRQVADASAALGRDRTAGTGTTGAGLRAAIGGAIAAFRDNGAALDGALGALLHDGQQTQAALADIAAHLADDRGLDATLVRAAADLRAIETLAAGAPADLVQARVTLFGETRSYTMASERAVHSTFAGGGDAADSDADVDLEDLLF